MMARCRPPTRSKIGVEDDEGQLSPQASPSRLSTRTLQPTTALYLDRCDALRAAPDPAVIATLEYSYDVLTLSPQLTTSGCLAPLVDIFPMASHIRTLRLATDPASRAQRVAGASGDVDARLLRTLLGQKHQLTALDLSWCGLSLGGLIELSNALQQADVGLTQIDLAGNKFGNAGCSVLATALQQNTSVRKLDLSFNWLHHDQVELVRTAMRHEKEPSNGHCCCLRSEGNNFAEEIAGSITHGLGACLALCGAPVLLSRCTTATSTWACMIYMGSLVALYTASTLFHAFFMMETTRWVLGIIDHCAIFLLIAGTYTPFALISLQCSWQGMVLGLVEWSLAIFGMIFSYLCINLSGLKARPGLQSCVQLMLYLLMGWAALAVWDQLEETIAPAGLELLIQGGYAYTGGVVFFLAEKVHPSMHVIWHLFVLVGSIAHFFCVLLYVVEPESMILGQPRCPIGVV